MRHAGPWALVAAVALTISIVAAPAQSETASDQAARLIQTRDWKNIEPQLERITREHPDDAEAWYGLGRSLQEIGKYREALVPLTKALELGYRPAFMQLLLARSYAALGDARAVASRLEKSNAAGFPVWVVAKQFPEFEPQEAALEAFRPCSTAEYRQFDFWIGEWDVYNPAGQQVGSSRITPINDGCAIREEWTSATGTTGSSFNFYDPRTKKWNQFWVGSGAPLSLDDEGNAAVITGGLRNGSMILSSNGRVSPMNRITWTPLDGGAVRQLWEQSKDDGKTWSTAFDGKYVPKKKP